MKAIICHLCQRTTHKIQGTSGVQVGGLCVGCQVSLSAESRRAGFKWWTESEPVWIRLKDDDNGHLPAASP